MDIFCQCTIDVSRREGGLIFIIVIDEQHRGTFFLVGEVICQINSHVSVFKLAPTLGLTVSAFDPPWDNRGQE